MTKKSSFFIPRKILWKHEAETEGIFVAMLSQIVVSLLHTSLGL